MTAEMLQIVLVAATIVGFALTAYGIVGAYRDAKKEVRAGEDRILRIRQLMDEETSATDEYWKENPPEQGDYGYVFEPVPSIEAKFEAKYDAEGLTRPSLARIELLSSHEAVRLLKIVLDSTRGNLIWAGVGLLLSTAASVASLIFSPA